MDRANLIHREPSTVHASSIGEAIKENDLVSETATDWAKKRSLSAPGGVRTVVPFSTDREWDSADTDRKGGCIRDMEKMPIQKMAAFVFYTEILHMMVVLLKQQG